MHAQLLHVLSGITFFPPILAYVEYLCSNMPELIEEAIFDSSPEFVDQSAKKLRKKLRKDSSRPTFLSNKDTAELFYGKSDLSQRGYKHLRKILLRNNVHIPCYEVIRKYCKDLNVGDIKFMHGSKSDCLCMGVRTDLIDSLQRNFSSDLYEKMNFFPEEQNKNLCKFLKSKDSTLYHKFDPKKEQSFYVKLVTILEPLQGFQLSKHLFLSSIYFISQIIRMVNLYQHYGVAQKVDPCWNLMFQAIIKI